MRLVLAALLAATPALAETPLSAEQFDALTLGRTLQWTRSGTVYAVEQYLPDRKVLWAYPDDACKIGSWYPKGEAICFRYEEEAEPVCWEMTATPTGFSARLTINPPDAPPVMVEKSTERLACTLPELGT